jgi:hypothetical protein
MAHPSIRTYRRYFSSLALKVKEQPKPPQRDQGRARIRVRASGQ